MAIHTVGTALGSAAVPILLGNFGGTAVMGIAGICQLLSGVVYYIYMKKNIIFK